jgi:hypothetical protein
VQRMAISRIAWLGFLVTFTVLGATFASHASAADRDRLSGPDVIRRQDAPELPANARKERMILHGNSAAPGLCRYSLEFTESSNGPDAVLVWVAAVDTRTCEFELERATFERSDLLSIMSTSDTADTTTDYEVVEDGGSDGNTDPTGGTTGGGEVGIEGGKDDRLTVVARWRDPANIDVTKVLAAVRSYTNGGEVIGGECKYARSWLQISGWEYPGRGSDFQSCKYSRDRDFARAETDGHFKNSKFPTCIPDTVHVYYDRV